jgi:hypothetical protein
VAIDDVTRLAYANVPPDANQANTVGFLIWAEAFGLTVKRNMPYTPLINGKQERFIKILVHEWASVLCLTRFVSRAAP